jgi:hypothetical protein
MGSWNRRQRCRGLGYSHFSVFLYQYGSIDWVFIEKIDLFCGDGFSPSWILENYFQKSQKSWQPESRETKIRPTKVVSLIVVSVLRTRLAP